jgi:hypothetical protein
MTTLGAYQSFERRVATFYDLGAFPARSNRLLLGFVFASSAPGTAGLAARLLAVSLVCLLLVLLKFLLRVEYFAALLTLNLLLLCHR